MYDVIISGAGPSGSKSAQILAKAGYKVALLEKDINWRKPCGGALNPIVFEHYPQLKKLSLPKLKGIVMHSADYHYLEYSGGGPPGTILDRLTFDNFIRKIAIETGAEIFNKNITFDLIVKDNQKIGVKSKTPIGTKEYFGKIIIIADGMSSKLAIRSGLRTKWKLDEIALAKCSILQGNHQLNEHNAYIFFRPYKGYGWIFPLDNHHFNIGIYTFGEDNRKYNIHEIYHEFLNDPQVKKYISASDYKTIWTACYLFPILGVLQKSLYDDNLMIVGDAGGFISPISGEAIHTSIISGKIAAETAIAALEQETYSKKALKEYKQHPEIKTVTRDFKLTYSMTNFFYENKGQNLNRMLALTEKDPEFKSQVIDIFTSTTLSIPSKEFFSRIQDKK